ncbi:hypothetical protein BAY59_10820 [Prauserella coralliicola]|nr:hypothetical protein BAY59_10820 [Prauserella coralliicola]
MSDETLRNAAADAGAVNLEGAWFAIHDGATALDQVSSERLQPAYDVAVGSEAALTAPLPFTGPASAAASHLGVWDAQTNGNLRFVRPLSGDLAFNAAGELTLAAAPVTVA